MQGRRTFAGLPITPRRLELARLYAVLLLALAAFHGVVGAATITVTNTGDSGAGSLRQAILNSSAGETINFNIPASDPGHVYYQDDAVPGEVSAATWAAGDRTPCDKGVAMSRPSAKRCHPEAAQPVETDGQRNSPGPRARVVVAMPSVGRVQNQAMQFVFRMIHATTQAEAIDLTSPTA